MKVPVPEIEMQKEIIKEIHDKEIKNNKLIQRRIKIRKMMDEMLESFLLNIIIKSGAPGLERYN